MAVPGSAAARAELVKDASQGMTVGAAGGSLRPASSCPHAELLGTVLSLSAGLRDRLQGLLFLGDFVLQGLVKLPR